MRNSLIAATMALLVIAPDTPQTDRERIQGTWVILDVEFDGVPIPESPERARLIGSKLTFQGEAVLNSRQPDVKARFTLDASAAPPTLDIISMPKNEERRMLYTYLLDGEMLRLCFTRNSGVVRPADVTSNNKQVLFLLKRQQEQKKD
jgi:uncharacterized protein (TIGR03067 family)